MKAVVLVGGEGTRLRPLTFTIPKPLLPIANIPFLERQLSWLGRHGVREVVLSLGYLPDAFVEHFPDGRHGDVSLRYAVEAEPLGTAGGIRYAAERAGIDERFVVCNGDVLTGLDLTALVRFHDERRADATIHLARVDDPSAYGVVPTGASGEVTAFVEKPPPGRTPSEWINAGTYVLDPTVLDHIPPRSSVSIERETFPHLLDGRARLYAQRSDAYWIDIGTPEKYLRVQADMLAQHVGAGSLPADASERAPGVWVQGDVLLDDTVRVDPPVLLGAGARLAGGACISASVLGPGCVVAEGARAVRSVLLEGARLGTGAEVVDAVVGPGAVVEAHARVSDCSIVGPSAVVASGAHVAGARIGVSRSPAAR